MEIRRSSLSFRNVLCARAKSNVKDWYKDAQDLRNAVIRNGLYATGPMFYKISNFDKENQEAEYSFYIPVNKAIKLTDSDIYTFYEEFFIEDGMTLRHVDLEEKIEESYSLIRLCAQSNNLELVEPFYNIYLDVYGSGIIDIYAPIKGEK